MKHIIKPEKMKEIIESMDSKDIPEMVNAMLYETCQKTYEQYEQLRDMVNDGTVLKEMVVHNNMAGMMFGEPIDRQASTSMYMTEKKKVMKIVGKTVAEYAKDELDEDVQLDRKLASATKDM